MDNVVDVVLKAVNFTHVQGLNHRLFNSLLEIHTHGCTLPYHIDIHMLIQGVMLKHFYDLKSEIELKFKLFEHQLVAGNTAHFPTLKTLQDTPEFHGDINIKKYYKIPTLVSKIRERFPDLGHNFSIFCNPFAVSADEAPEQFQLELIELQCNSMLKD
ncbi:general transcription factor II-I repeat domain-containing protein 2A-like [Oratosquilla oratoria]|uniref:general transcription factor II-I repeat domain-containing protein 2A-like n=1 Tax=Oratosquilla oratoria TaxID=337810 RepID=UPI003F768180